MTSTRPHVGDSQNSQKEQSGRQTLTATPVSRRRNAKPPCSAIAGTTRRRKHSKSGTLWPATTLVVELPVPKVLPQVPEHAVVRRGRWVGQNFKVRFRNHLTNHFYSVYTRRSRRSFFFFSISEAFDACGRQGFRFDSSRQMYSQGYLPASTDASRSIPWRSY